MFFFRYPEKPVAVHGKFVTDLTLLIKKKAFQIGYERNNFMKISQAGFDS
jgi:hypothetical protein